MNVRDVMHAFPLANTIVSKWKRMNLVQFTLLLMKTNASIVVLAEKYVPTKSHLILSILLLVMHRG